MDSTADTKKTPRAYILDLPTELLQQIAGHCSDETLVTFRLTCRKIEAATLDMWAKEFVSRLECFMLDPARLERVKSIISSRLASHVRGVVFTLSACDSCTVSSLGRHRPPDLAPEEDMDYEHARIYYGLDYEVDQYDIHACELQGLSPECDSLVLQIMHMASGLESCSIGLDTQCETTTRDRISQCRPQLAKDLIASAVRENCTVTSLWLAEDFPLHAMHFELGGAFESVSRKLRKFSYLLRPESESDLQTARSQHHWRIITNVLQQAERLEHFEITNNSSSSEVDYGMVIPNLFTQLFTVVTGRILLHTLRVTKVNLTPLTLHKMLDSCADTLKLVQLTCLGLRGDGDVWSQVFASLHGMPRIKKLLLDCLYKGATDSDKFDQEGWLRLEWKSGEVVGQMYEKMMVGEQVDARAFLDLAVKAEIEYHEL